MEIDTVRPRKEPSRRGDGGTNARQRHVVRGVLPLVDVYISLHLDRLLCKEDEANYDLSLEGDLSPTVFIYNKSHITQR